MGIKEISIDKIEYALAVSAVKASVSELDTSLSTIAELSRTNVATLKKYVKMIDDIADMLERYKALLRKDTSSISQVGLDMEKVDNFISAALKTK